MSDQQPRGLEPGTPPDQAARACEGSTLPATESLCPICLRAVPALRVRGRTDIYLSKSCPEHGESSAIIWRGAPDFESWYRAKPPCSPSVTQTARDRGCPWDCGLCPEHAQGTCCVLLEVTARCDLRCPVCFASSGESSDPDPSLEEIASWYRLLLESAGACNIQLSGGEPTMRDDLPQIISLGRQMGFSFFQLNTNGLRLASDPGYAVLLKQAGLSTVFLQFDGLNDGIHEALRGEALCEKKDAAIENCAAAGLGVVLVPTLVPGVNTDEIGRIIQYAIQRLPYVRGVHFQPISYFGRYPAAPRDEDRYTLPELMRAIEQQTGGLIPADSLRPSCCEHSLCSFHGDYILMPDGSVSARGGSGESRSCRQREPVAGPAERKRDFVARHWPLAASPKACCERSAAEQIASMDDFLERVRAFGFTITAMAFQDVWTLDLERLRNCCLHVVKPGGTIIPFCSYNLTDSAGRPLHRGTA